MSERKTITQIITEAASDPKDPLGQTLRKCPCVRIFLDALSQEQATEELGDWLDNQDVMQALHISLRSLQHLRSNGTLPYSRINNKIYYRRSDIEDILNDNYKCSKICYQYVRKGDII